MNKEEILKWLEDNFEDSDKVKVKYVKQKLEEPEEEQLMNHICDGCVHKNVCRYKGNFMEEEKRINDILSLPRTTTTLFPETMAISIRCKKFLASLPAATK